MKLEIHIHMHDHADDRVIKKLEVITQKLNNMPTKAEFAQIATDLTTALENIAADITRLTDQLAQGGLTDAEEQEIFTQFRAIADRATTIAGQTPDPEAPPEG